MRELPMPAVGSLLLTNAAGVAQARGGRATSPPGSGLLRPVLEERLLAVGARQADVGAVADRVYQGVPGQPLEHVGAAQARCQPAAEPPALLALLRCDEQLIQLIAPI